MMKIPLLVVLLAGFAAGASAAPSAELWPRWQPQDVNSKQKIDHAAWDGFLKTYVKASPDGINRVTYGKVAPQDKQALASYVDRLSKVPVTKLSRAEQLPYWVNLYNALTIKTVLEKYPVASIRDINISPGLFSSGPWGAKLVKIEGEEVTLDDIEHRILRPIWKDARIHYAVNCASIGCPNLLATAFTAENADQLLTEGAKGYVNNKRGVRFEGGKITASKIYDWFQSDFGGSEAGVLQHLAKYAEPGLADRLKSARGISGYEYDWSLNDAK
jgi:hypothetical protein